MKRIPIALLAAASLAVASAQADTRVSIGVSFGLPAYRPAPPAVIYAPPPAVVYARPPAVVVAPARGYWKEVVVQTWVPERWVVRHNRWGRPERYCEPGYYAYRTEHVWVDARDPRFSSRGYGYGYDRHDDHRGWKR